MNEVSQILRQARLDHGLSLEDVAQKTYIKVEYLEAIEDADLQRLPEPVHVSGYIRQVARIFELDGPGLASKFLNPDFRGADSADRTGVQPALPFRAVMAEPVAQPAPQPLSAVQHLANVMEADTLPIRDARREAEQIIASARAEAQDLVRGAESYAHEVLGQLEADLFNTLNIIRNGRRYLQARRVEGFDERNQD